MFADKGRTFVILFVFFQDKMSFLLGMSGFGVYFAAWVDDNNEDENGKENI